MIACRNCIAGRWTAPGGDSVGDLVRGGNTIWLFEEYQDAPNSFGYRIVVAANATSPRPLRTIPMTDRTFFYAPQHLSIVGGSLLQKMNVPVLAAYRIPGGNDRPPT